MELNTRVQEETLNVVRVCKYEFYKHSFLSEIWPMHILPYRLSRGGPHICTATTTYFII
jgi:hypothetical protein